jgi:Na+/proline symporter
MVMLGMFAGVLVTGLAFAPLRHFYESTARGSLTLPELLRIPYGVAVCGVVGMALIAFQFAERLEKRA